MRMDKELERVMQPLRTIRCGAACTEEDLHALVAEALSRNGIDARHEVPLAPRCRIDFLAGGVGIEIKKSRPEKAKLLAQLARYAQCEQVAQLLVIAPRGVDLPERIGGKRVTMLALERLWGVSLP